MVTVCIGIHLQAEPARLRDTLLSLQKNTPAGIDFLLLPDGPDEETRLALSSTFRDFAQSGTSEARGAAACFNRLAAISNADVLILLESGAQVGPNWLELLLTALQSHPQNGIAGPSTNSAWNEQSVFSQSGNNPAQIARTAFEALQRFGNTTRTLEPLYSLADFCYAVRREVVEAIGAAEEAFGLGPCWEMDYNIRAARAGFRAVWACAAYVHRAPFTARRQRDENTHFEASRRLYQEKFCALRLLKKRDDFEPHCRGDECEHFAPPALIQIHLPLSQASPLIYARPAPEILPLVSCIMPTRNRADFALQAVRYFQAQDYPNKELIIVDDGDDDLGQQLPTDDRLIYLRVPAGMSIGAKRNRACQQARGSIIAHWDDDDWYAPNRLSVQVAPLLSGEADICGLYGGLFFELDLWQFWKCSPTLHRRMFVQDVHGGTLVYLARCWQQLAHYPDVSLAEDAIFLTQAMRRGARLRRQFNQDLFVYLRHGKNSWAFPCGQFLDPQGWTQVPEPAIPMQDRAFYAAHSLALGGKQASKTIQRPLVSCIMPTYNRRQYVGQAIQYFLRQDYAEKELIIVDDGSDSVIDLIPAGDERIRYIRLNQKESIGAKRNRACQEARGSIIMHWDDDDWMADYRVSYQVEQLLAQKADVCGLSRMLYYDPAKGQGWQYCYPSNQRPWVTGNTLCYQKSLWQQQPFQPLNSGEDTRFIWGAGSIKIAALPDYRFYVGIIHSENASPKQTAQNWWQAYPAAELEQLLGVDWTFYQQFSEAVLSV